MVHTADFNGDGNPDLAVCDSGTLTVSVLLNNGDGTFAEKIDYTTGAVPRAFTTADLNGDGNPDLAIANEYDRTVAVMLNVFATHLAFGQQPESTADAGAILPAVTVRIEDQNGNLITTDHSYVTLSIASGPDGATLGGMVTVTAVNGVATFSDLFLTVPGAYTLCAADGALAGTTSASFTITAVNSAPVVVGGATCNGAEDQVLTGPLGASDPDGDLLTFALVASPAFGSVGFNPDGTFHYTPLANWSGTDCFTFTASDGELTSDPGTVNLNVAAVNDAPVLAAIPGQAVDEGSSMAFAASATDVENDVLTFSLVDAPVGAFIDPTTGVFDWVAPDDG
jgi:hypothetical protein